VSHFWGSLHTVPEKDSHLFRLSPDPATSQRHAVHGFSTKVDCGDSPRVGNVLERITVEYQEVRTFPYGHGAEICEFQHLGRITRRCRNDL
jgi:hypothetical protein